MARRTEILLDRETVISAAFAALNELGLDRLTMRAVAQRLSVHPPALYWHFRDKAELLTEMAATMNRQARAGIEDCADWQAWLDAFARGRLRALMSCRDGARLGAIAPVAGAVDILGHDQRESITRPLTARGMSEPEAHAANASIMAFTLGWAAYLSNAGMAELLGKLFDPEVAFERGLAALIRGLGE